MAISVVRTVRVSILEVLPSRLTRISLIVNLILGGNFPIAMGELVASLLAVARESASPKFRDGEINAERENCHRVSIGVRIWLCELELWLWIGRLKGATINLRWTPLIGQ